MRYGYPAHYQERDQPVQPQEPRGPDPVLLNELGQLKSRKADLESELARLKKEYDEQRNRNISDYEWNGLGPEFGFGARIYQCEIPPPGLGHRNTPSFADKNPDGCGPEAPQCIEADAIVQGAGAGRAG